MSKPIHLYQLDIDPATEKHLLSLHSTAREIGSTVAAKLLPAAAPRSGKKNRSYPLRARHHNRCTLLTARIAGGAMNNLPHPLDSDCPTGRTAAAPSADTAQQHQQHQQPQPCPDWLQVVWERFYVKYAATAMPRYWHFRIKR